MRAAAQLLSLRPAPRRNCNNLACEHNDCTAAQVIAKCVDEQDMSGKDFSGPPTNGSSMLVPVNLQLELTPARLEIREELNEMVLQEEVAFSFQWQDVRLQDSPCKAVLSHLLSLTREEANSDLQRNVKAAYQHRFWLPKMAAEGYMPGYCAAEQLKPAPAACAVWPS